MESGINIRYAIQRICTEDWIIKKDHPDYCNIVFILKGKAHYIVNGNDYILNESDVLFIPADSSREAECVEGYPLVLQAFDFYCTPEFTLLKQGVIHIERLPFFLSLFQDFNRHWLNKDPLSSLHCQSLFYQILDALCQIVNVQNENIHVHQMKNYIESHLSTDLSMTDLAWATGLNTVYCGALFKKETGMTAAEYRRSLQIRKACQMLQEPDISISEAAWQSGFDDLFYFSKTFKKAMGISPKAYQKRIQNIHKKKEIS